MRVSIITASYNSENTIKRSVESVQEQTHADLEHVIIDGGSTDKTISLIESISPRHQVQLISEPDDGIYDALNKGINLATGEIIGFLHSDDRYSSSDSIKRLIASLGEGQLGVYSDLNYVNPSPQNVVRRWKSGTASRKKLKHGWMPPHPTLLLNRSVYENLGVFDTSFTISADYEFILRVFIKHFDKIDYLPSVEVLMNTGGISNRNLRTMLTKTREDIIAMRRHGIPSITGILLKNISKLKQLRLSRHS